MTLTIRALGVATAVAAFSTLAPAQTDTTTTQSTTTTQTAPTATTPPPSTTTQTTTTQTGAGQVTLATAADVKAGVSVFDEGGALVGTIDSVDSDSAIINTGKARADVPLASFGKNDKGLVVSLTKAELDAQAKTETTTETKTKTKTETKTETKPND